MLVMSVGSEFPDPVMTRREGWGWYSDSTYQFISVVLRDISPAEAKAFTEPISFALVPRGPLLLLLFKPGEMEWGELVWANLEQPDNPASFLPPPPPGEGLNSRRVDFAVTEQSTGVVTALRSFTFSAHLSRRLLVEQRQRLMAPALTESQLLSLVKTHRANHPRPAALLGHALVTCTSGD